MVHRMFAHASVYTCRVDSVSHQILYSYNYRQYVGAFMHAHVYKLYDALYACAGYTTMVW